MNTPGISVSGASCDSPEFKHVFQHPVAGARIFIGHLTQPSNDPYLREAITNSWAVFQGVGEPEVNPLMPSKTRRPIGIWVCPDDAVAEEIYRAINAGKELGFKPYCGDASALMMIESNRTKFSRTTISRY